MLEVTLVLTSEAGTAPGIWVNFYLFGYNSGHGFLQCPTYCIMVHMAGITISDYVFPGPYWGLILKQVYIYKQYFFFLFEMVDQFINAFQL